MFVWCSAIYFLIDTHYFYPLFTHFYLHVRLVQRNLLFHCYSLFLSVIYHFYLPLSLYLPFCWGTVVEVRAKVGPHSLWEQPCWPVVMLEQRGCPVLMSWSVKLHLQQLLYLQLVHGCGVVVLQQTHLHVAGLLQGIEDSICNKK